MAHRLEAEGTVRRPGAEGTEGRREAGAIRRREAGGMVRRRAGMVRRRAVEAMVRRQGWGQPRGCLRGRRRRAAPISR